MAVFRKPIYLDENIDATIAVGSLADIVLVAERKTSVEEINQIFIEEAASDRYREILRVTEDPIVSSDIIKDPRATVLSPYRLPAAEVISRLNSDGPVNDLRPYRPRSL